MAILRRGAVVLLIAGPLAILLAGCPWSGQVVLSPDGQRLAVAPPDGSIMLLGRDGKDRGRAAAPEGATNGYSAFLPDSKSLVFWRIHRPATPTTAKEDKDQLVFPAPATVELVLLDLKNGKPRVITQWRTRLSMDLPNHPHITPDGHSVVIERLGDQPDNIDPRVHLVDLKSGAVSRPLDNCMFPTLSADGKQVMVVSAVGGLGKFVKAELARQLAAKGDKEAEGPKPEWVLALYDLATGQKLAQQTVGNELPRVSAVTRRDGFLAKQGKHLGSLDLAAGKVTIIWRYVPSDFVFSRDGRWVLAVAGPPTPASTQPEFKTAVADEVIPTVPPFQGGRPELYLFDRKAGPSAGWKKLHETAAPLDIDQLNISDDGRTVAFIEYFGGGDDPDKKPPRGRLLVLDVPTGKLVCDRDLIKLSQAATQPEK